MLNHAGELIGVNVAIAENSNNVGFAIPSFHLLSLFDALATRPKNAKVIDELVYIFLYDFVEFSFYYYLGIVQTSTWVCCNEHVACIDALVW